MLFFAVSCNFPSFRPKYLLQYPILKHPEPVFSPCCGWPSLTPILNKSILRQFQRMRCSLRTCVACHTISVPSEETKCYISEARSRVQPHLALLTWQPTPTHQLSYLGSAWIVPCCIMSPRRLEFSVSDPSQMWIFCGSHSDAVSWIYARTCTWADGDRTGVKFDVWLLGRMITGVCHRYQVTSYKCWISQVLLGVTLLDRVPNETKKKPKPKRWMVLNVVYQYHCHILK